MDGKPLARTSDHLEAMRQGVNYRFPVQIRGWTCWLRPLAIDEQMQVNNEVIQELSRLPENLRHSINENHLLAKKILEYASKEEAFSSKEGPLQDSLLKSMTLDEILMAYDGYMKGCEAINPRMEEMKREEIQQLVEQVKKTPSQLTELSSWQLINLARFLISDE